MTEKRITKLNNAHRIMRIIFHVTLLILLCKQVYSQSDTINKWEYSCSIELINGSNYKDYEIYILMDSSLAIRKKTSGSNYLGVEESRLVNIRVITIKTIQIKTIKKGPKIKRFTIGGVEGFAVATGAVTLNEIREKGEFEMPNSRNILSNGAIGFIIGGLIALSSENTTMHIDGNEERYLNYRKELSNYSFLQ